MYSKQFKALANPARVKILILLGELKNENSSNNAGNPEELSVNKIVETLPLSPSTISHHLNVLKSADLVKTRKEKQWIYYSVNRETINEIQNFLDEI